MVSIDWWRFSMVSSERSRMDENGKDEKLDGWGEVTVGNKRLANKRESLRVSRALHNKWMCIFWEQQHQINIGWWFNHLCTFMWALDRCQMHADINSLKLVWFHTCCSASTWENYCFWLSYYNMLSVLNVIVAFSLVSILGWRVCAMMIHWPLRLLCVCIMVLYTLYKMIDEPHHLYTYLLLEW